MSNKKIGISCESAVVRYGELKALELCAAAGFDAVDFGLEHYGTPKDEIYKKSDEEIFAHFATIKRRADELGLEISQTHGRCATFRQHEEDYNEWEIGRAHV